MAGYQRLGEMLVSEGILTQEELEAALQAQKAYGNRLGTILIDRNQACEADISRCLAKQMGLELLDPKRISVQPDALALVSFEDAWRSAAIPFRVDAQQVHVVVSDPLDIETSDKIALNSGRTVQLYVAAPTALREMIKIWFGREEAPVSLAPDPSASSRFAQVVRRGGDATGTWFSATDTELDREVLLAAVRLNSDRHAHYLEFLRWAASVRSELVVRVFETQIHNRRRWATLEAARGETLSTLADRGGVLWGREILGAITELADLLIQQPCGFLSSRNVFVRGHDLRIAPITAPEATDDRSALAEIALQCAALAGADEMYVTEIAESLSSCRSLEEMRGRLAA